MSKQDFIKSIDRKRFALPTKHQFINQKIAGQLKETCERYTDYAAKDDPENLEKAYAKRFCSLDFRLNDRIQYSLIS